MKQLEITTLLKEFEYNELDPVRRELVDRAKEATRRAYAPFSKYNVGASLLLDNGKIIEGSNQENAAYPSGLCAERTAVFFAGKKGLTFQSGHQ